jgi:Asp-tRNA(Asn)/Glu-tRNA(Gln) amidotransferase A subunit family amidase
VTDLHYLSATEVLRAFNAKELSPVEVFDAVAARADAVEPSLNSLIERDVDASRAQAVAAEERYAAGAPVGVLDGLPVVMKEEQPIVGRPMSLGTMFSDGWVCEETHPLVQRTMDAGAIVHARSTTPEFCCAGFTHSKLWGITRNPWNLDYSPGGSSGGSGAALAAGTGYLASGSDIGGSIRIPASFCGVVGYKAPYGRVPAMSPWNLDSYAVDGAMARTVADCALFQNVIAGQHPSDHVSMPKVTIPDDLGDVKGLRVALAVTLGDFPIEPEIEANTRAFADALRAAGAIVDEIEIPILLAEAQSAALAHWGSMMGPSMAEIGPLDDERFTDYARMFIELSNAEYTRIGVYGAAQLEGKIQMTIGAAFDNHDALICPTIGTTGFIAGEPYTENRLTVAGREIELYILACQTVPFNIASRHPVLSVPSGRAANGVPTGVQVVARPYDDVTAFHVGAAAERELALTTSPSWRPAL